MSILSANNISQSLGHSDIFDGLSIAIAHDDRIGLIGPNGVGKTTLLRTIAGLEKPRVGTVSVARGKRIGYVQQEAMEAFGSIESGGQVPTLRAVLMDAFAHVRGIEARMRALEALMTTSADETALAEYGELLEQFEHLGGYTYEERIGPMMEGLQLSPFANAPVSQLSGGQKTRAMLARALLAQPDLLILDEPTNHLDIDAIEWLEGFLQAWPGALLIVSHDRRFLDKVANKIWEMLPRAAGRVSIEQYRGNYSVYTRERALRLAHEQFLFDQEKDRLLNELRLIKIELDKVKGGNDVDVSWAKGKLRRVTRDCIAIEQFGVGAFQSTNWLEMSQMVEGSTRPWIFEEANRRVNALRRPEPPRRIDLRIESVNRGSNDVIKAKGLVVGYVAKDDGRTTNDEGMQSAVVSRPSSAVHKRVAPHAELFSVDELLLVRGQRVALLGANGSGKTTLLRTMFGQVAPLAGTIELGPSVTVAYFAQAHDMLNLDNRLMAEFLSHNPGMKDETARHLLSKYQFRGDDLDKIVRGLSGGERARLALAILAQRKPNLLVLDEPTNHLDIYALEVLEEVLSGYDGSMLLVSHDRHLVGKLASDVWHIENRSLHVFHGTYDEWIVERQRRASATPAPPAPTAQLKAATTAPPAQPRSKNAQAQQARALQKAEEHVAACERELKRIASLLDAGPPPEKAVALSADYASAEADLEKALAAWEALHVGSSDEPMG